mmetsp:Transcript_4019/g.8526  ORF Transcript_4019/g.8526 Transcript_4019/m.8526 type:complete len:125 (+) Transcript_4019:332-706(+)
MQMRTSRGEYRGPFPPWQQSQMLSDQFHCSSSTITLKIQPFQGQELCFSLLPWCTLWVQALQHTYKSVKQDPKRKEIKFLIVTMPENRSYSMHTVKFKESNNGNHRCFLLAEKLENGFQLTKAC